MANELAPPEKPSVGMTVLQTRRSRMSQRCDLAGRFSIMTPFTFTQTITLSFFFFSFVEMAESPRRKAKRRQKEALCRGGESL